MSEPPVTLLDSGAYLPPTRTALAQVQAELATLLPEARVEEVGTSALPGALSKGDLDVCVSVDPDDHAAAVQRLIQAGYRIKADTLRGPELCMLEAPPGAVDLALQVVARGSRFERIFLGFRDALRAHPELVQRYNAVKQQAAPRGASGYRAAKAAFIAEVLDRHAPLLPHALQARLRAAYAEPGRVYHATQHLDEVLALHAELGHLAEHPDEVAWALWFHDAVYDVKRHDNEARSAEWAVQEWLARGRPAAAARRIEALVLATCHTGVPATPDEQLLVDIDLAILGAAPERFAEYETQIRQEYAFVPEAVFAEKRAAILAGFAARPVLYGTAALRERLEAPARCNLAQAIAGLAAARGRANSR